MGRPLGGCRGGCGAWQRAKRGLPGACCCHLLPGGAAAWQGAPFLPLSPARRPCLPPAGPPTRRCSTPCSSTWRRWASRSSRCSRTRQVRRRRARRPRPPLQPPTCVRTRRDAPPDADIPPLPPSPPSPALQGRVGDGTAVIMRAIAECGAAAAAPMREASLREGALLQHLHRALFGPRARAGLSRELVASWADQYGPAIALLRRVGVGERWLLGGGGEAGGWRLGRPRPGWLGLGCCCVLAPAPPAALPGSVCRLCGGARTGPHPRLEQACSCAPGPRPSGPRPLIPHAHTCSCADLPLGAGAHAQQAQTAALPAAAGHHSARAAAPGGSPGPSGSAARQPQDAGGGGRRRGQPGHPAGAW
jgi:hypothetical protein